MSGIKVSEEFFKKFGKKFPPEAVLAREGESGNTMFLINSGKVVILKNTPAGEKTLATLSEGDFFGEMAIMGLQDRRGATVKAVTETLILELNREAFEGMIKRSPEIAMSVIRTLTERVRDANGKLSALMHKDDRIRLSTYLNYICNERGQAAPENQPGRCIIFKSKEVGSAVGVSVEVVNDFVNALKKARMLGQSGDWIWIPFPMYLVPFGEYLAARETLAA